MEKESATGNGLVALISNRDYAPCITQEKAMRNKSNSQPQFNASEDSSQVIFYDAVEPENPSKLRSSEHHSFDVRIAVETGSVELAILINHLMFWINSNAARGLNYIEKRTWMYQTIEDMAAHFPYFSIPQVKRLLSRAEELGIIIKGNFNKKSFDRTHWYAFVNEEKFAIVRNRTMHSTKSSHLYHIQKHIHKEEVVKVYRAKEASQSPPPPPPFFSQLKEEQEITNQQREDLIRAMGVDEAHRRIKNAKKLLISTRFKASQYQKEGWSVYDLAKKLYNDTRQERAKAKEMKTVSKWDEGRELVERVIQKNPQATGRVVMNETGVRLDKREYRYDDPNLSDVMLKFLTALSLESLKRSNK